MAIRSLSLFSGAGMLDLGVSLAIKEVRTVCYVEREAYCAATLVARMADGILDEAPIWDDIKTFPSQRFVGKVDLILGGFPCQDISNAGKRKGIKGTKSGLWKYYARIIQEIQPRYVFIENVSALINRGLDQVLSDLANLGFDAEWDCFRASDVGAPHRRNRIFILAYRHGKIRPSQHTFGQDVVNPDGEGLEGRGKPFQQGTYKRTSWPPGPKEHDPWVKYLQLYPNTEPSICRGTHGSTSGLESRINRLRLLGNGVVPQVAALALKTLIQKGISI